MRRGRRLTFIIVTIVSAAIATWLPAIPAHAVQGTVKVSRSGQTAISCPFGSAAATLVSLVFTCGNVKIENMPGYNARVQALTGSSQNNLVIAGFKMTNLGASATVEISANHKFTTTDTNALRSYGIGLNVTFSRKNASNIAIAATGNQIKRKGSYTYYDNGGHEFTDQIGGAVGSGTELIFAPSGTSPSSYTAPIPPLTANESNRSCANLTGTNPPCEPGEKLTSVLTLILTQVGDVAQVSGGDHTVSGGDGCVNAFLASLTVALRMQQNTPNPKIDLSDKGYMIVELLCNDDFPCEAVDQGTLLFGPAPASPVSVQMKDVDGDGDNDLRVKVSNQQHGIVLGDTAATLSGTANVPGCEDPIDFDALVGFYTVP
jgi:hypothetical protein